MKTWNTWSLEQTFATQPVRTYPKIRADEFLLTMVNNSESTISWLDIYTSCCLAEINTEQHPPVHQIHPPWSISIFDKTFIPRFLKIGVTPTPVCHFCSFTGGIWFQYIHSGWAQRFYFLKWPNVSSKFMQPSSSGMHLQARSHHEVKGLTWTWLET